jgi:two-component system catabolic regulation response regulator CreB
MALTTPPVRILVVEDEPAIRDMVAFALRQDGFEVVHTALGSEALAQVAGGGLAAVILDVGLPDLNGFEVGKRIRALSGVPVLFLTARSDEVDRVVGLEIGDDYLVKPFSPRELVARVRNLVRRAQASSPSAVDAASPGTTSGGATLFEVDIDRARIAYRGVPLDLTRYEFLLLQTLLEAPERVFSRAQLMDRVWTDAPGTADRTVDTHVKTVRAKLRAVDAAHDPIVTHRSLGYSIRIRG